MNFCVEGNKSSITGCLPLTIFKIDSSFMFGLTNFFEIAKYAKLDRTSILLNSVALF